LAVFLGRATNFTLAEYPRRQSIPNKSEKVVARRYQPQLFSLNATADDGNHFQPRTLSGLHEVAGTLHSEEIESFGSDGSNSVKTSQ
jgi:hypothetical protein